MADNLELYNFNDIGNSFMFLWTLGFVTSNNQMTMAIVSGGGNYVWSWIFFLSYWFWGTLIMMNIMQGCLLDF